MLLTEYLTNYTARRALALAYRTAETERYYIAHYIAPISASVDIDTLTGADILRILTPPYEAGHTRTAAALWVYLSTASKGCDHFRSVMISIPRPKHQAREIKILTPQQLHQLITESPEQYRLAWFLAGVYGLRRGEICGLQFQDIDTDGIHINRQRIATSSHGELVAPLKSAASRRVLPITDSFLNHYELREVEHLSNHESDSAFVIPLQPHSLDNALTYCLKLLQLPKVSLHSLRHAAASIAVNSSDAVNLRVLQSILGHASIDTTARIYSHVSRAALRSALETIAADIRK